MRKILKKHLAIGVSIKSVNSVRSGFIPTFDVALAQKFDMKRVKGDRVYVEPKLDGIRCLAVVENGEAKIFTDQTSSYDLSIIGSNSSQSWQDRKVIEFVSTNSNSSVLYIPR